MATYGEAFIELHARTDKIPGEAEDALERMGHDAEDTLDDIGENWGEDLSKGMARELENRGPDLSRAVERGLGRRKVKMTETVQFDRDNNVVRRWVRTVTQDVEDAFADASGPGGPFNRIGTGIADAIGAGFNVSGRSSLIVLLVPLIGVIVGLVGAALQAINALAAVATTLPALLTAIGLQVGVLMAAFNGLGAAIQGAFAAKNAKELQEAIKGLTLPAQQFVKALLPLKRFFQDLQMVAQANFFGAFGADVIPRIFKSLGPTVFQGFITLARVLGETFRDIALFFASSNFRDFVKNIIPSTVKFLQQFGPSFTTFLKGLIDLANASLPFLNSLGSMLSGTLTQLGVFFSNAARDPKTLQWFKDMQETLEDVLELFGQAVTFVTAFLASLNKGGGPDLIKALADAFEQLAFFFGSEAGQKAIEGLADAAIFSIKLFVGLVEIIGLLFAGLELIGEFLNNDLLPLLEGLGAAVLIGLALAGSAIMAFFRYIGAGLMDFFHLIGAVVMAEIRGALIWLERIHDWFQHIGERAYKAIKDAFASVGRWLYDQGRRLIQGFLDGIYSMLGLLRNAGSAVGHAIAAFLPGSPAKEGPLSGQGYVKLRGERMVQDLTAGIKAEMGELRNVSNETATNIAFGPNSIRVTFEGAVPTEQQARTTGSAVGSGILDKLAVRNTRLAVRTL